MANMAASGAGVQTVELSQLPLPQLENLKAQLDEEIRLLTESMNQLKVAQQKFVDSKDAVKKLSEKKGDDVLVPLSASMYAPGQLESQGSVLVDIGTGYFASKSLDGAEQYFLRKIAFVTKQMERVQPGLIEKHKIRQGSVTRDISQGVDPGSYRQDKFHLVRCIETLLRRQNFGLDD